MSERPKFEEFKRRLLANPDVRRAYIEAKIRNKPARPVPADHGTDRADEETP